MTKQLSFSKYENALLSEFRQKINHAESEEDLKKFFAYTAKELFENVFAGKIVFEYDDVAFRPGNDPHYQVSERLLAKEDFKIIWDDSDLPHVMARFARPTVNRFRHLAKHPEKTDAKIRM